MFKFLIFIEKLKFQTNVFEISVNGALLHEDLLIITLKKLEVKKTYLGGQMVDFVYYLNYLNMENMIFGPVGGVEEVYTAGFGTSVVSLIYIL